MLEQFLLCRFCHILKAKILAGVEVAYHSVHPGKVRRGRGGETAARRDGVRVFKQFSAPEHFSVL